LNVWCDAEQKTTAKIEADNFDGCVKVIELYHSSGCAPAYNMLGFIQFMSDNYWLSGTALVIIGGLIGIFG